MKLKFLFEIRIRNRARRGLWRGPPELPGARVKAGAKAGVRVAARGGDPKTMLFVRDICQTAQKT